MVDLCLILLLGVQNEGKARLKSAGVGVWNFLDFSKGGLGDAEYLRNGQCSLLLMGKSRGKVAFACILNAQRVRIIYKPCQCL